MIQKINNNLLQTIGETETMTLEILLTHTKC